MSEVRDLLRSVGGSIDKIDRTNDDVDQSVLSRIVMENQRTSVETKTVTASVESLTLATQIQGTSADNAEERLMEMNKNQTGVLTDSRKLQKTNVSGIDWKEKNVRIKQFSNISLIFCGFNVTENLYFFRTLLSPDYVWTSVWKIFHQASI